MACIVRKWELARSQCHHSCAEEMDNFLSFCRDALNAVFDFESSVPKDILKDAWPNDGPIILNWAFTDALHFIQSRSHENLESGRTAIRGQDEMAGSRETIAITRAIETGAITYVFLVVQALKVSSTAVYAIAGSI